jgi:hypothetical protein
MSNEKMQKRKNYKTSYFYRKKSKKTIKKIKKSCKDLTTQKVVIILERGGGPPAGFRVPLKSHSTDHYARENFTAKKQKNRGGGASRATVSCSGGV